MHQHTGAAADVTRPSQLTSADRLATFYAGTLSLARVHASTGLQFASVHAHAVSFQHTDGVPSNCIDEVFRVRANGATKLSIEGTTSVCIKVMGNLCSGTPE